MEMRGRIILLNPSLRFIDDNLTKIRQSDKAMQNNKVDAMMISPHQIFDKLSPEEGYFLRR